MRLIWTSESQREKAFPKIVNCSLIHRERFRSGSPLGSAENTHHVYFWRKPFNCVAYWKTLLKAAEYEAGTKTTSDTWRSREEPAGTFRKHSDRASLIISSCSRCSDRFIRVYDSSFFISSSSLVELQTFNELNVMFEMFEFTSFN